MKIKSVVINRRKIIYGKGTFEEIEALNVEKDFETALLVLEKIRRNRKNFFDSTEPNCVNREIYGKRKASGK